ncbi:MAG: 3-hydroxybutyryl-CoA dehydrogenase [Dehalococcoidia bacterium]|nr:MAG: 3-hydroxybutyryl-CoA dehydrogenase [Dehalococcoidia bacterium]
MTIKTVGVAGCGIMGGGIAQLCASHGYDVSVLEVDQELLDAGLTGIKGRLARDAKRGRLSQERYEDALRRLRGTTDIQELSGCDLVIEAIVEDPPIKEQLFAELGRVCKPEAILASNTSSLSLSTLAAASGRPEKVIGLHFFNPPTVLLLVEVISSQSTSQETIAEAMAFCDSIDRLTVRVKDTPGFIVNRLLVPFIFDAIRMVESGTATAEDIDQACKAGLNHAMGPLATADLVGLDTLIHIGESMFEEYGEPRFKAPTVLRRMVSLGHLGRKSGKGFFDYAA